MNVRRAGARAVSALLAVLICLWWVAPAAAAECALTAPETASVGIPVTIAGAGFPPGSSVELTITIRAGPPDRSTIKANAAGAFLLKVTPDAADVGKATVVATAGSTCTARAVFTVEGPSAATSPRATISGSDLEPAAPITDASPGGMESSSGAGTTIWLLAIVITAIGIVGRLGTRPARSR